jgi:hypothetical protein
MLQYCKHTDVVYCDSYRCSDSVSSIADVIFVIAEGYLFRFLALRYRATADIKHTHRTAHNLSQFICQHISGCFSLSSWYHFGAQG